MWAPIFVVGLLLWGACGKESFKPSRVSDFKAYIAAYPTTVISRTAPLQVAFTAPYGQSQDQFVNPSASIRFEPSISGKLSWADPYTLQFEPDKPLPSGTTFQARLNLEKVITGIPDSLREFRFQFATRRQHIRLTLDQLVIPNTARPGDFRLTGSLKTNDFADNKEVEACLGLDGFGADSLIAWTHDPSGTEHRFDIYPVKAGAQERTRTLTWDGAKLGLNTSGKSTVIIPSQNSRRVLDCRPLPSGQQGMRLSFSRPLDPEQDLTGMVYLSNQPDLQPQFLVEGNLLTCYFPQRLDGVQQIAVMQGIRLMDGSTLKDSWYSQVDFSVAKPQIRLLGTGNILPHSEKLHFPFEAINLNAVEVEIFKIYHTNILQFLQVNSLDGQWELQRVGEIVWRGQVDLTDLNPERNNHEWVRYALDLAPLIQPDPKALYQVRIGFWKEFTDLPCESPASTPEYDPQTVKEAADRSIMDAWAGRYGYFEGYSWDNREDPCAPEYYNSDRFISRNVLSSNIGLTCKRSLQGDILVVATDLRNASPISGAEITFFDYQLQVLHRGKTSGEGLYLTQLKKAPEFVFVRQGDQYGYLVLQEQNALSVSDFPTDGIAVQEGLRGFPYAERGVWRPGDSVFLNLILHDPQGSLPSDYPVTMELTDPRGRLVKRMVNHQPKGPVYAFHFPTSPDDPTGLWTARFLAGGAIFTHPLRVETIRPNRLKLVLDLDKQRLGSDTGPIGATLSANWLHGAPAAGQQATIQVTATPMATRFKGFEKYVFDHPEKKLEQREFVWAEGNTDQDGRFRVAPKELLGSIDPAGKVRLVFKNRVSEPGGGASQDFQVMEYDAFPDYCGISLPLNQEGYPVYGANERITVRIASVDASGRPKARKKLKVRLIRKEWRWWWEQYSDNRSAYTDAVYDEEVASAEVITDGKGLASWSTSFDSLSRYLVEVCDPISGHCSAGEAFVWSNTPGRNADARYFQFTTDKESYKPGEEIRIGLPSSPGGKALVSLETGSRIIEARLVDLKQGGSTLQLPVTSDMTPNVYVHLSLIQGHGKGSEDLPLRLYGIRSVKVEEEDSRLMPTIEAPSSVEPDKPFTVTIGESRSKAMSYTLAIVDEGLLDLTRFKTPDPHASLFSKEALGVRTWDLFDQVIGGFTGEARRVVAIGGDEAAIRPQGNPRANRFKPALVHLGPFTLEPGKRGVHRITLPNYYGSVRVMVVGAGRKASGAADKTLTVKKPLMVAATMPRQLGIRDQPELAVTVFASEKGLGEVKVSAKESTNLIRFLGPTEKTVRFSGKGEQTVYFPIQAGTVSGVARFEVTAQSGSQRSSQRLELSVRNPNPIQTVTHEKLLAPGQSHTFRVPVIGTAGSQKVTLTASSLPPVRLADRLSQLVNYPFGCLEQTVSAALPMLLLSQSGGMPDGLNEKARQRVDEGVRKVLAMKDDQGRLMYWPEGTYHHPWSEIYAMAFLSMAKESGYGVPEKAYRQIVDRQRKLAGSWNTAEEHLRTKEEQPSTLQAFRLYALALANEGVLGAMNRLKERKDLAALDRWLLAGAYARMGRKQTGAALVNGMPDAVSAYSNPGFSFGSDLRDLGLMCLSAQDLGQTERAYRLLRSVAARLNSGDWYATHSMATGLWAYARYAGARKGEALPEITYTNAGVTEKPSHPGRTLIQADLIPRKIHNKPLLVKNTGRIETFIQIACSGKPDLGAERNVQKGLELEIRYLNMDGTPLDVSKLSLGKDFQAIATVKHRGATSETVKDVALSQYLPSGWEIRNVRMEPEGGFTPPPMSFHFQDIRDDSWHTFLDLVSHAAGKPSGQSYHMTITAAYPGKFYLPAQTAVSMYDPDFTATLPGKWVEVFDSAR